MDEVVLGGLRAAAPQFEWTETQQIHGKTFAFGRDHSRQVMAKPCSPRSAQLWRAVSGRSPHFLELLAVVETRCHDGDSGDDGVVYCVSERVRPLSTEGALPQFSDAQVRALVRDLLRAVSTLHTLGFVHHDIKPGNLLLGAGDRLLLADFDGIVRTAPPPVPVAGGFGSSQFRLAPNCPWVLPGPFTSDAECHSVSPDAVCSTATDMYQVGLVVAVLLFPCAGPELLSRAPRWRLQTHNLKTYLENDQREGGPLVVSRPAPAVALMYRLLEPDMAARATAEDALLDPFLQQ